MSAHAATLLLGATWMVPFALLLACLSGALRRAMPRLLVLAPLPGLAAAAFALGAPALEIGAGRLRLVFELDGPGALLLGVAALLWSAAGAYAATYMRDTPKPATSSAMIRSRLGESASAAAASRRPRLSPGISPASITSATSSTDSASSASTR